MMSHKTMRKETERSMRCETRVTVACHRKLHTEFSCRFKVDKIMSHTSDDRDVGHQAIHVSCAC